MIDSGKYTPASNYFTAPSVLEDFIKELQWYEQWANKEAVAMLCVVALDTLDTLNVQEQLELEHNRNEF